MSEYAQIENVCSEIKKKFDSQSGGLVVSILYAFNSVGKTRLSKLFSDNYNSTLYYNVFTEDLFSWDNDTYTLNVDANSWLVKMIMEQGLEDEIKNNFKKFTNSRLEPIIDWEQGEISFHYFTGEENPTSIKISKAEESLFIWTTFFTILELGVTLLNEDESNRESTDFNEYKYIIIDDPVSSIDDNRIVILAVELINLILRYPATSLKFLITTHHALFYNILRSYLRDIKGDKYILSKTAAGFELKSLHKRDFFAYHHVVRHEIEKAIQSNDIKKYHFNLFRSLLEKTASFLGYQKWEDCLAEQEFEIIKKYINNNSHNTLSDLEYHELEASIKESFRNSYQNFIKDFKWSKNNE